MTENFKYIFPNDAEHVDILYHSLVRWLGRGNVLNRLYSLRLEID